MKGFVKGVFSSIFGICNYYFKSVGKLFEEVPMYKAFVKESGLKKEQDPAKETAKNTAELNAKLDELNKNLKELTF